MRFVALAGVVIFCGGALLCFADDPKSDDENKIAALLTKIDDLTKQIEALKAENADLKQALAAKEKKPATTQSDSPAVLFELGPDAALGNYKYKAPSGWTAQPPKDNKLATMYRSSDKAVVILVQVKPKGAAPPEMQSKYAQSVIQLLKQDFAKGKTEVLEPPAIQKDSRFFLRIHEKIKVKEKAADQTHLYQMAGKDALELTVITTSDSTEQVAATIKLAEDILLSFKPDKTP